MNAGLQPRGLFTVDGARTLEALSLKLGAVYETGHDGSRWLASRRDGTGDTLRGLTPDDLAAAMRTGGTG